MLKFSAFSPLYGEGKSISVFQQRQVSGISRCDYLCVLVMGLLSEGDGGGTTGLLEKKTTLFIWSLFWDPVVTLFQAHWLF